jgi:dTDP-L-rhamnose 4-epimerase
LAEDFLVKILVTGGAGFIGSHTVDALLENGHEVRIFDNLESQVHGPRRKWPAYLDKRAECVLGDIRARATLAQALSGVDVVFHLAAATGVGQSMYQISKYFEVNVQGTANFLDILTHESHQVQKLIVASSRAVYGEGAYRCGHCGVVAPEQRSPAQMDAKQWDVACPHCTSPVTSIPTPESKTPRPASMYAITKLTQEQMCLCFGKAYGMPVVVLRYFNVYGPRQSFSNPYTGIITAFLSRLFNGKYPEVYEDGRMTRDFVHVSDVVRANMLAMERNEADGQTFNAGTGVGTSIWALAELLCDMVSPELRPQVVEMARVGDIRHCTADPEAARKYLGYEPRVRLQRGLWDVMEDVKRQEKLEDASVTARRELAESGLLR